MNEKTSHCARYTDCRSHVATVSISSAVRGLILIRLDAIILRPQLAARHLYSWGNNSYYIVKNVAHNVNK
jgi:hypothetical protein